VGSWGGSGGDGGGDNDEETVMAGKWLDRWNDAWLPFQTWDPFPPESIVQIKNAYGDSSITQAKDAWWGYQEEMGRCGEEVITKARRLDRPHPPRAEWRIRKDR